MAADSKDAVARLQLVDGYRFTATFPSVAGAQPITLDEAPPLGEGAGPTPAGLIAAAIGGCVSASLTLCLNKAHLEPDAVNAHVIAHIARNAEGRLRIEGVDVDLTPCFAGTDEGRFERCKALYEDFCIVTESVRRGIPVHVHLARCGEELKRCAYGKLRDFSRRLMIGRGAARASRAPVAGLGYLQDQVEDTDEQQQVEEDAHQITSPCEVEKLKS